MPDTLAIALDRNVAIPLRDGVATRADAWRPVDGGPRPAILIRTPYRKESLGAQSPVDPRRAAERGYALVDAGRSRQGRVRGHVRALRAASATGRVRLGASGWPGSPGATGAW